MKDCLSIAILAGFCVLLLLPQAVFAAGDIDEMRRQLEEQRALIQAQQQQLERQARELDRLSQRLDEMSATNGQATAVSTPASQTVVSDEVAVKEVPNKLDIRDEIGDLNHDAVVAGDFPGSFKIPGRDISMKLGGFIKVVGGTDSDSEGFGTNFLPAYLSEARDQQGASSIDATLSRLFVDGRAPTQNGGLRGYIEWDLNDGNNGNVAVKMRHAYGSWQHKNFSLVAGHTWSTMMDLLIIPEGLTEPTVSGVIFMRQPQIRVTQAFDSGLKLHAALEDPNSDDVYNMSQIQLKNVTNVPDMVVGIEYGKQGVGHLRLNSILRRIEARLDSGGTDTETAWGISLSGHVNLFKKDVLRASGVYGEGLGRYLLGIQSSAGGATDYNSLELQDNWGVMSAYEHHWNDKFRSTIMGGYAHAKVLDWRPGETFESSIYTSANLLWQVLPYMTLGVEYAYGQKENKDNSDVDNHRIAVGMQFF